MYDIIGFTTETEEKLNIENIECISSAIDIIKFNRKYFNTIELVDNCTGEILIRFSDFGKKIKWNIFSF